jgi:tRNA(Ile)-lysidine synthase
MEILKKVAETIEKNRLLSPGQIVIAGISGGADSLCLLNCLNLLGYQVTIAHLDHQLREESAQEAQFVRDVGQDLGIEVIVERGDVRELADRGYSLEEAARLVRYQFLARVAHERDVDTIATGHTADDQIETVLMHFLRGAGPSGLRGILPDTRLNDWVDIPLGEGIHLVRPLIDIRRSQTEAFCRELKLVPIQDPSNKDPSFFRNRIRHQLIPILKGYNPGIENIILRMARVMEAETKMVEDLLTEKWRSIVLEDDGRVKKIDRVAFEQLPLALKRSFIRRLIKKLRPDIRDIGFVHVEHAVEFLSGSLSTNKVQLLAGLEMLNLNSELVIVRDEGQKLFFPEYPQIQIQKPLEITIPSCIELENGWTIKIDVQDITGINRADLFASLDEYKAALDMNTLEGKIHLRKIQPGDRISPLGMGGSLKVSDLFINNKIPQPARMNWPLIVDDRKVIWVVGLRIADDCRIRSSTKEIILLHVMPSREMKK